MAIRQPIKDIGKQTALYGLGNTLTKLAAFFLIPIYTRYLSVSEVGIIALLEMVELLLLTVAPVGIANAMWRFLPNAKESDKEKIVISAYVGTLLVNVFILAIIGVNYIRLGHFFGLDSSNLTIVLLVLMNILFALGIRLCLWLWQYRQKGLAYVILSSIQFIGVLMVTIIFVIVNKWGLWGVFLAKALVFGLLFIYTGFVIVRNHLTLPSFNTYVNLLRYGFPLVLLALVTPMLSFSDRFFLKIFSISLGDIGIYSIGYKFGMLINMFLVVPIQRGWGPMMYQIGIEEKSHEYHRDILFYYAIIGSLLFLGISFFIEGIISVIATEEYISGAFVVPIITFAYLISGLRLFFLAGAALKDRTPQLAFAASWAILANLISNYVLIKNYGITGAAWATLISYLILVLLVYYKSQKLVQINWSWIRLIKLGAILMVVFIITTQAQVKFNHWSEIIGVLGIFVFTVLLILTKTISYRELNGIKSLMSYLKPS